MKISTKTKKDIASQLAPIFKLLSQKKFTEVYDQLCSLLKRAEESKNSHDLGLVYSVFGMYYRSQKEYRKAWKSYEQAEKLIPHDPSIKLISTQLLIDQFAQYDLALRKIKKIKELAGNDFTFLHKAYTLEGLAYLKLGDQFQAIEAFKKSMGNHFEGLQTSYHLDLKLIEALMKKKLEPPLCKTFLEEALLFAKKKREKVYEKVIGKLLALFPVR